MLILDPLSRFLPAGSENHPALFVEALAPLQPLTERGVALLLVHHPRKANATLGALARGSGGLDASADILIEMYRVDGNNLNDRRRHLIGLSRDPATPPALAIELNADGTDYTVIDVPPDRDALRDNWLPLRIIFDNAEQELTRQAIHKAWPASFPRPAQNTLWRWLGQAVERGLIQRSGAGTRLDPFRYFFAQKRETWQAKREESPEMARFNARLDEMAAMFPTPPGWEDEGEGDDALLDDDYEAA